MSTYVRHKAAHGDDDELMGITCGSSADSIGHLRRLATPAGRRAALHNIAKKTGSDIGDSRVADALIEVVASRILRDLTA